MQNDRSFNDVDNDRDIGGRIVAAEEDEDDNNIMKVYYAVEIYMKSEDGVNDEQHRNNNDIEHTIARPIASDEIGDYDYTYGIDYDEENSSDGRMNRNDVEASITQVMNGLARADLSGCTELESRGHGHGHGHRNRILNGGRENNVNVNFNGNANVRTSASTSSTITAPRPHRNYGRILAMDKDESENENKAILNSVYFTDLDIDGKRMKNLGLCKDSKDKCHTGEGTVMATYKYKATDINSNKEDITIMLIDLIQDNTLKINAYIDQVDRVVLKNTAPSQESLISSMEEQQNQQPREKKGGRFVMIPILMACTMLMLWGMYRMIRTQKNHRGENHIYDEFDNHGNAIMNTNNSNTNINSNSDHSFSEQEEEYAGVRDTSSVNAIRSLDERVKFPIEVKFPIVNSSNHHLRDYSLALNEDENRVDNQGGRSINSN